MCRMFAVRADVPVRVDRAFHGLRRLASEHKDGWGVARFDGQQPWIETSIKAANECPRFGKITEELCTKSLLAHIRLASVGGVHENNTHPFFARGLAFMHNGTLHAFKKARERFEREIAPEWRKQLRGDTDSERCFALFLTYLDGKQSPGVDDLARALAKVMNTATALCDLEGHKPSAMNFVVSDGYRVVSTRRGRTLFSASGDRVRFIASEHLWAGERWDEVPEDGVVTVDADLTLRTWRLSDWS